jgi:hypothetical protein
MLLLDQAGVIDGRKKGHQGRLVVKRAAERRRVLGLPLNSQSAHTPGRPVTDGEDLSGRYEPI